MDGFFSEYKDRKIALYGLGTETQKFLFNWGNDFEIIGLLDGFREDGELYGKSIISFNDAVRNNVQMIIAVARPGSCRAIAKRIGKECRKYGISLMDIRGKDLLADAQTIYDFANLNGITKAELKEKIQEADIISFDLFDTLVMRQTLAPDDIISYVNCRLKEKGLFLKDFCKKRLQSEKELSRCMAPTLIVIYHDMLKKLENRQKNITAEQIAELEWEIDFELIIPRRDVCDIYTEVVKSGKKVYIVSDTYYDKKQLEQILKKCKITGYVDILSSSDYGTSKQHGLYEVLKEREKRKKFLHIGDDIISDIESARKHGLEACRLMSAVDLLEAVGNLGLDIYMDSMSERLKIGLFIARIFNSPFQFEREDRHISISDMYDIGYMVCAPIISDFVIWFYSQMRRKCYQNIWFSARDGYLIKKMYEYLTEACGQKEETVYFLTSRIAAIRAGVRNEKDILYVDDMKFSGTLEENLKERFGLESDHVEAEDITDNEIGLMRYKKSIIKKAKTNYINYKMYLNSLNIKDGDVAFFDFVAKGTSQMYIQRLISNRLKGFYFLQLETEYMKDKGVDIDSFYKDEDEKTCAIYDNYYILETILTAPHSLVTEFDDNGQPVYALETRTDKDIRCFQKAQEGILDYFRTYIKLCPETERTIDRKLDEVFLEMVYKIRITDKDFLDMVVEDPFFNRMTGVKDLF